MLQFTSGRFVSATFVFERKKKTAGRTSPAVASVSGLLAFRGFREKGGEVLVLPLLRPRTEEVQLPF